MALAILNAIRRAYVRLRYSFFSRPYYFLRYALFGRRKSLYNRFLAANVERNHWHPDRVGESNEQLMIRLRDEYHQLRLQLSPRHVERVIRRLEREVAEHALREDPVVRRYRRAERDLEIRLSQPDGEEMRERLAKGLCSCGA